MTWLLSTAVLMRQFDQSSAVAVVYTLLLLAAAVSETVAYVRTRSPISAMTAGLCWGLVVVCVVADFFKS
jgi:hypothetical protein